MEENLKQSPNNTLLISGLICVAIGIFLLVNFINLYKELEAIKFSQTMLYLSDPLRTGLPGMLTSKIENVKTEMTIYGVLMGIFFIASVFLFLRHFFGDIYVGDTDKKRIDEIH